MSIHSLWPSHSTWCLVCCPRTTWHTGDRVPSDPSTAPTEHMGLFTYLDPGLALQKQSSSGELPASLHESCSSLVRFWATAALAMLIPQLCCLFWGWTCILCSLWPILRDIPLAQSAQLPWCIWSDERISTHFQNQREGGRGKMRGSVLRCFVPVQLTLRETFRPYLQSGRSAQNPCLIISYLYRCSGIRVWMLARHLGKDLG